MLLRYQLPTPCSPHMSDIWLEVLGFPIHGWEALSLPKISLCTYLLKCKYKKMYLYVRLIPKGLRFLCLWAVSTHAASDSFQTHLDAKPKLTATFLQQPTHKASWVFSGKKSHYRVCRLLYRDSSPQPFVSPSLILPTCPDSSSFSEVLLTFFLRS